MRGNDLSNASAPRYIIVWEGGMAHLPEESKAAYDRAVRLRRWWEAIACWMYNPSVINQIERLARNAEINIEIITWMGDDAAMAIQEDMEEINIPVRGVFASSPGQFSRDLAFLPDIAYIYDPDPGHVLTYGRKGVIFKNANQIGRGN
jgi:hypothetical protein